MKKYLFTLAFAAALALTVQAADYTDCGDVMTADQPNYEISSETVTTVGIYLTRLSSPDFTNFQFDIIFPDGIRPGLDEYQDYGYDGDFFTWGRMNVTIKCRHNLDVESKYPVYTVLGVNQFTSQKFPETQNPCCVFHVNVKADKDLAPGTYDFKTARLKYTDGESNSYATAGEQVICTLTVGSQSDVKDLGADKSVASVKYINVAGVESAEPYEGMNIMVTTYNDGTTQTRKIIK